MRRVLLWSEFSARPVLRAPRGFLAAGRAAGFPAAGRTGTGTGTLPLSGGGGHAALLRNGRVPNRRGPRRSDWNPALPGGGRGRGEPEGLGAGTAAERRGRAHRPGAEAAWPRPSPAPTARR